MRRCGSNLTPSERSSDAAFQEVVLQYTQSLVAQCAQSVVCHRFHTASQRLSKWLLVAHDRTESMTVELTQEFLAQMRGIHRSALNAAALELQAADVIRYRHGKITIVNRRRLERAACERYHLLRNPSSDLAPALAG